MWRESHLEVSSVRVRRLKSGGTLKAFASVTFDEMFVVHDIRVVEGQKGLFVAMPSRKTDDGYRDVAHPITSEARHSIHTAVLQAYNQAKNQPEQQAESMEEASD